MSSLLLPAIASLLVLLGQAILASPHTPPWQGKTLQSKPSFVPPWLDAASTRPSLRSGVYSSPSGSNLHSLSKLRSGTISLNMCQESVQTATAVDAGTELAHQQLSPPQAEGFAEVNRSIPTPMLDHLHVKGSDSRTSAGAMTLSFKACRRISPWTAPTAEGSSLPGKAGVQQVPCLVKDEAVVDEPDVGVEERGSTPRDTVPPPPAFTGRLRGVSCTVKGCGYLNNGSDYLCRAATLTKNCISFLQFDAVLVASYLQEFLPALACPGPFVTHHRPESGFSPEESRGNSVAREGEGEEDSMPERSCHREKEEDEEEDEEVDEEASPMKVLIVTEKFAKRGNSVRKQCEHGRRHNARNAGEGAYASTGGSDVPHARRAGTEGAYASTGGDDPLARHAGEGAYVSTITVGLQLAFITYIREGLQENQNLIAIKVTRVS
eukprot:755423-Hanusia_phi.AAC.2